MAFNPNAVFISHSSLGDFEKCPRLYYLRNVYKSPETGLKIQIINPPLALGQVVHDTLEKYTSLEPSERNEDRLMTLLSELWGQIKGEKGGFKDSDQEQEYRRRAEEMLKRFFRHPRFKTGRKAKIPDFPKAELGDDIILTGKLDWIEEEDGGYHVIDFKTGQNEEKENSLQLPIYALLASKVLKNNKIKTSYWYVDHDEDLRPYELPSLEDFAVKLKQKGMVVKKARLTNSFSCSCGGFCWACRDMEAVVAGKGKLVGIDPIRKQEIYILSGVSKGESSNSTDISAPDDVPF